MLRPVQTSRPCGTVPRAASGSWGSSARLVYYIHFHSGTFWLVVLAFLKSLLWPAFVVYHVLLLK